MSPEAWTFLGTSVVAICGLLGVIIARQGKQNRSMGVVEDEEDPTLRSIVQSVLDHLGVQALNEAAYHAEQESQLANLADDVKQLDTKMGAFDSRLDRVEDIVLGYGGVHKPRTT